MILEGLVTTVSATGELNIAPMGPLFDPQDSHFELRPFETSNTFRNLTENPAGVLHVTDDVLLMVQAAINEFETAIETVATRSINGRRLVDCCRWYEFEAVVKPTDSARRCFHCRIVSAGRNRDFYGFNRAKHAILEATIAVTRIGFLPEEEIQQQLERAASIVDKTGGEQERAALKLLHQYLVQQRQ